MVFQSKSYVNSLKYNTARSLQTSITNNNTALKGFSTQVNTSLANRTPIGGSFADYLRDTGNTYTRNTVDNSASIIQNALGGLQNSIANQLGNVLTSITNSQTVSTQTLGNTLANALGSVIGARNNVKDNVTEPINSLLEILRDKIDQVTNSIRAVPASIKSTLGGLQNNFINSANDIKNTVSGLGLKAIGTIRNFGSELGQKIVNLGNGVITKISGLVSNKVNSVIESVQRITGGIKKDIGSLIYSGRNFITEKIEGVRNFANGVITKIGGLFQYGKEKLFRFMLNLFETAKTFLSDKGRELFDLFNGLLSRIKEMIINISISIAREFVPLGIGLANIFDRVIQNRYNSVEEIVDDINGLGAYGEVAGGAIKFLVGAIGIVPVLFSATQPFAENIQTLSREFARPTMLSPDQAASAFYRGDYTEQGFTTELRKLGYSDERLNAVKSINRPLLSPTQIQVSYLRGMIQENEHDRDLEKFGYTSEQVTTLKELYRIIPPPQDLITMAVREVFSPDVVERFGQDEDFPEDFATYAAMQGLTPEWARRYWAAHWGLPSPRQGFEMLHRRIIDEDTLKLLLRALDVMPFWRDNLIQLSYNPITRVDVRRLYRLGIYTREQVYDSYLDLGYSPERAEDLTQFTEQLEGPKVSKDIIDLRKTLISIIKENYLQGRISSEAARVALAQLGIEEESISAIISVQDLIRNQQLLGEGRLDNALKVRKMVYKAYRSRSMSREDAEQALRAIGIDSLSYDLDLDDIDLEVERGIKGILIDRVKDLYMGYTITESEVHSILGANGFVPNEIDELLRQMNSIRNLGERKPTKADLDKFLAGDIIDIRTYEREMLGLRYNRKYVDWFLQLKASVSQ